MNQIVTNNRRIFKDEWAENQFKESGYVILPLPEVNLIGLLNFFNSTNHEVSGGFFASLYSQNDVVKIQSDLVIKEHVKPQVENYLIEYTSTVGNFMVKTANDLTSKLPLHQDWNIVEESTACRSMNVWIPLMEIEDNMGKLHILKNTHKLLSNVVRGSTDYPSPLYSFDPNVLENITVKIDVPFGYACFMDHALVHYSPANTSKKIRVCASLNLKPIESALIHYNFDPDSNSFEKYAVNTEFFLTHKIGTKASNYQIIENIQFNGYQKEEDELKNYIYKQNNMKKYTFIEKIVNQLLKK